MVGLQAAGVTALENGDIPAIFEEKESKTFGMLLTDVRKHSAVDAETADLLRTALGERNRLVHRFMFEHQDDFLSAAGRGEMIEDLRDIIGTFRDADAAASAIGSKLWESLGITAERIRESFLEQFEKASARDATA